MKKVIVFSLIMLISFAGCNILKLTSREDTVKPDSEASLEQEKKSQENQTSSSKAKDITPDAAAEELLSDISNLDDNKIKDLANQYFLVQDIPEEYYGLLKPISSRITYKIGNSKIEGDNAAVDISVSAVDAKSAFNNVMPGAVAHLAAMQITGKDISSPEKVLAEYAAENIDWDALPTIRNNATLYLVMGADGNWKVDADNADNLGFLNAVSGGAVEIAQNLKSLADRFK